MADLDTKQIAELRELLGKATAGEWCGQGGSIIAVPGKNQYVFVLPVSEEEPDAEQANNARLIAAMHNALPALLDAAEELSGHKGAYATIGRTCEELLAKNDALTAERDSLRELAKEYAAALTVVANPNGIGFCRANLERIASVAKFAAEVRNEAQAAREEAVRARLASDAERDRLKAKVERVEVRMREIASDWESAARDLLSEVDDDCHDREAADLTDAAITLESHAKELRAALKEIP